MLHPLKVHADFLVQGFVRFMLSVEGEGGILVPCKAL
jgi:hypothetical protein